MYSFDTESVKNELIKWTKDYFADTNGAKAVIGISGGKDSSAAAAVCAQALGSENVIGVLLPNKTQRDIEISYELCDFLNIKHYEINIGDAADALYAGVERSGLAVNNLARINTPPRIRMAVLYAVCAVVGGRVVNTGNLSEKWVGYCTKYGDATGDVSLFSELTVTEVRLLGKALGLPDKFCDKTPEDGLSGLSDEENLGFTYARLDCYIRTGVCDNTELKNKIDALNKTTAHKREPMPCFIPGFVKR